MSHGRKEIKETETCTHKFTKYKDEEPYKFEFILIPEYIDTQFWKRNACRELVVKEENCPICGKKLETVLRDKGW